MSDSTLESAFEGFLSGVRRSTWRNPELPDGISAAGYYSAPDGIAVEVALVADRGAARVDDLRRAWRSRHGGRATALLLVAARPGTDEVRVVGLRDAAMTATIPRDVVDGVVDEALQATSTESAESTLATLFVDPEDELPRGLRNGGLLASHSLVTTARIGARWSEALATTPALRTFRGLDLLQQLGWKVEHLGQEHLLKDGVHPRAVAVLLAGDETFDRPSLSYGLGTSPVEHALQIATSREIAWVVAAQGPRLRLYSADPGRGVARSGGAPFVEVDVTALGNDDAAYAPLLFAPAALRGQGAVERLLEDSRDHAVALGARLRDRIYADAVPMLAETIARRSGDLSERGLQEAYHCTLMVLFRLLFVAYAEDRGLLPYRTNAVYTGHSVKARARSLAESADPCEFDPAATDMWHDLLAIWSAVANGNRDWGVPAYGGRLFRNEDSAGQTIAGLALTNAEIGPVLWAMLVDTTAQGEQGPVDFRSLSVREFGTIYEGLLESSLSVAPSDLTLHEIKGTRNVFVPARPGEEVVVRAGGVYFHNASGARKATGSYFTKEFAVEHLLRSALDPTLAEHLDRIAGLLDAGRESEAAEAFFDFRVADIAMGSGHFLVAAVDHIATAMEGFLTQRPIPGVMAELDILRSVAVRQLEEVGVATQGPDAPQITTAHLVRRQVAKRCLYGVDINEIAVDLARVALWIHTFVPGLPMSDLSHGLVHGNSLTGIARLEEALEILEPPEMRSDFGYVADSLVRDELVAAFAAAQEPLARAARLSEVTAVETREAEELRREAQQLLAPARAVMDAAVAGRLGEVDARTKAIAGWDALVAAGRSTVVRELLTELDPIHFPVAFPEVFREGRDGFDVILGNPPWEKVKVEKHAWWGLRFPGLRSMPQKDKDAALERYQAERPDLLAEFDADAASASALREVLKAGPYDVGSGDTDLYKLFCWRDWDLLGDGGRAGVVFPRGALGGSGTARWRRAVLDAGSIRTTTLINTRHWVFDEVDTTIPLDLVSLARGHDPGSATLSGPFHSIDEFPSVEGRALAVDVVDLGVWSPSLQFPLLPSSASAEVFKQLRRSAPLSTLDVENFRPVRELDAKADKNLMSFSFGGGVPILGGASFDQWNPDFGAPYAFSNVADLDRHLREKVGRQIRTSGSAFYRTDVTELPYNRARIAFRDVTKPINRRTAIACLVPPGVSLVHNAPYLLARHDIGRSEAYLLGVMCSIAYDWFVRRYIDKHFTFEILLPSPVPSPARDHPLRLRTIEISGRLAAVDERYAQWAAEVGVPVGSVTDQVTKDELIAELDAVVALLYGLTRGQLVHIFETFHRGWNYQPRLTAVLANYDRWIADLGAPEEDA